MRTDRAFKTELERELSNVAVPSSLYRFAKEVPSFCNLQSETVSVDWPVKARKPRLASILSRSAAAAVILIGAFTVGVSTSPAFAAYMKEVPGLLLAVDWLTQLRNGDGVQQAINHGYIPFEEQTAQFGGTTIMINDIYLTEEELQFKAFIQSNEIDVTDESGDTHYFVGPHNIRGGGSATGQSVAEAADGSGQPVLQVSYKFHLEKNALQKFLDSGQKELVFDVTKTLLDRAEKKTSFEEVGLISVPFDESKLLHNIVLEPKQALAISEIDPDWKQLLLEKLTIQPTTMNIILAGMEDWEVYFPRDGEGSPYLKDDKGNMYRYDPSGPILDAEDDGLLQLSFMSSVFFDSDVRTLFLHIGEVHVTGRQPSGGFRLSMNDSFPKTVPFMGRDIVIKGAAYHEEGYLHLEIEKEYEKQTRLEGVSFDVEGYREVLLADSERTEKLSQLRKTLKIDGWGVAGSNGKSKPALDLYLPAPEQEEYNIELHRWNDKLVVNKDFPIQLKP